MLQTKVVPRAIRPLWMIARFLFIWFYSSIGRAKKKRDVGSTPTRTTIYYLKSDERKWLIWKMILVVILIVIFLD